MGRIDQIGSLIPAVPTEENDTFWGYTSVPEAGCVWWRKLPNRKIVTETTKRIVTVNGFGDLAMTNKQDIGERFFFVKRTKSGLAHLQSVKTPKHFISVPMKNIDFLS